MNPQEHHPHPETTGNKKLEDAHWFHNIERIYQEKGEIPSPGTIRARAILAALNIPVGETSALTTNQEGKYSQLEKDRIIAEELTNKAGVWIDKEKGITSRDFRDIYPDGLPERLKQALDPATVAIMEAEYEHAEAIYEQFGDAENYSEADMPVEYYRLPGGVDVFLRGYRHTPVWQKRHGKWLAQANRHATVVAIETGFTAPGNFLAGWYQGHSGHYDVLMRESIAAGFNGYFTEVDARDASKINMDSEPSFEGMVVVDLPDSFYRTYHHYLAREFPALAEALDSPEALKDALARQTTSTPEGFRDEPPEEVTYKSGRRHRQLRHIRSGEERAPEQTFYALGQLMFTDALAAIRLHLIARLMNEGHIEKGPIIDYEGADHLSSKHFFLRYPEYAMEVVLRTINELMAGQVEDLQGIHEVFKNPDWTAVFEEMVKIPLMHPEDAPDKPVEPGLNQRKLIDATPNVLELLNIDSKTALPTDEEIAQLREKLKKTKSDTN